MKLKFLELEESEWNKFEKLHPENSFLQGVQRIRKRQQMGYRHHIVAIKDGDNIVAGGVLIGRNGEFWMPYGPLIDWDNQQLVEYFLSELIKFSQEKGFVKLEVFPKVLLSTRDNKGVVIEKWDQSNLKDTFADAGFRYQGETTNYQMKAGRWAFVKDISNIKTVDQLRASYRKTLRARLRQTDGQVETAVLRRDELPTLIGLIDESDKRNNVSNRELEYYQMMYDAFGDDVKFMVARKADDKTPIAGAIFVYHGHEVASYLSGMDRKYRDLNGRAWLQDAVMSDAIRKGIERVNFFWVEGRFENNHLLEFKSGFGGVVEEYVGGFEKIIDPTRYYSRLLLRKSKNLLRKLLQIPRRLGH